MHSSCVLSLLHTACFYSSSETAILYRLVCKWISCGDWMELNAALLANMLDESYQIVSRPDNNRKIRPRTLETMSLLITKLMGKQTNFWMLPSMNRIHIRQFPALTINFANISQVPNWLTAARPFPMLRVSLVTCQWNDLDAETTQESIYSWYNLTLSALSGLIQFPHTCLHTSLSLFETFNMSICWKLSSVWLPEL